MTATTQRELPVGTAATAHRAPDDSLAGLGSMIRLVLRRNRVRLVVWWVVIVGLFYYVLAYYKTIFTTQEALDDFATISNTPGIKAITGLAAAANTMGGAVWTKIWMTCALSLAFGIVFLVTRNGRADEEVGRTELLRSRVLGIHAYSIATWVVMAGLSLAVGLGVAATSAAGGLDPAGAGITGSLITGASMTGVGLVGLGVGAFAGHLASTSRGANALGSAALGVFYMLRMAGDLGDGKLTWASPIGWAQEMQPWGANRWWPLGLIVLLTGVLLAVAARLESHRDFGAGLLPERSGRSSAPSRFAQPLGLALRLQRGPIIGWTITMLIGALMLGSVVESFHDLLEDAGGSVAGRYGASVDALLSLLVVMLALITTVFAIQTTVSMRSDEASGIIEPQLSGAISRTRWVLQRLTIPAAGSAVLLLIGGGLMGATYGSLIGDSGQTTRLAGATLAYWPAVMVFVGLGVALFGWLPRLTIALSWGVLAAMWFVVVIGDALHLPDWVLNLLPFSATPSVPADPLRWTPLVLLLLAALLLGWIGLDRFRRRDIQPG